jgi:hypothetical protein
VNTAEARHALATVLGPLRDLPYAALVRRLLDRQENVSVAGASGVVYQVEIEGFWDDPLQPGNLRVIGSVDDGGWRAVVPLTDAFIITPDGSFVGE